MSINVSRTHKNDLLMSSLENFYKSCDEGVIMTDNLKKIVSIINQESNISLRVIDWFVTNYAKKNSTSYSLDIDDGDGNKISRQFIVHIEYKLQLRGYSKKQFDPFCRRNRMKFVYNTYGDNIVTNVGQLNFFRWAIKNGVLDYIENNFEEIDLDMNNCYKKAYSKEKTEINSEPSENSEHSESSGSEKKTRRKRHELSVSATKKLNRHDVKILVTFE